MFKPWELLDQSVVFSDKPWLEVFCERVKLSRGTIMENFYRIIAGDFSMCVPFTPSGEIVMVRGYKHGLRQTTLSLPAGFIDGAELPLAAAKRELAEETGYSSEDWTSLGAFLVDGNKQIARAHLFVARDVVRTTEPVFAEEEELAVELMQQAEVVQKLLSGEVQILPAAAAIALTFLKISAAIPKQQL